jgi:hypothetical protein
MVFFDTRSALVRTQEYELRTSISWDVDGHLIWDVDGYSRTGRRAALALPRFTISLSLSLSLSQFSSAVCIFSSVSLLLDRPYRYCLHSYTMLKYPRKTWAFFVFC